jgi:hypothetical protein
LVEQVEVSLPVSEELLAAGAYAARVRHPGGEQLFPDGTILTCLPLQQFQGELATGKRVILQRVHAKKVELTVRELEVTDDRAWLWPRSTHPAHQQPTACPWPHRGVPWKEGEDRYTILAVVIGAYIPQ